MKNRHINRSKSGFTLIEVVIVAAVSSILATLGYFVFTNVNDSVRQEKLKSEIATLNSAVATYLGFGGNLDDAKTADEVIAKLKSISSSSVASRIPGFSSSMVDPRIRIEYQKEEDVASDAARVYWNPSKKAFQLATSGAEPGIKAFHLDVDPDAVQKGEDTRTFTQLYAENDTWVWDYTDETPAAPAEPSTFTTSDPVTISFPGSGLAGAGSTPPAPPTTDPTPPGGGGTTITDPDPTPEEDKDPTLLAAPVFTMPGGSYPISEFSLNLSLVNPNPSGSSNLYYRVDFGNWMAYAPGSVLTVSPEQMIDAQAIANTADYIDSTSYGQTYTAIPEKLEPPVINTSQSSFGVFDSRIVAVVLEDRNTYFSKNGGGAEDKPGQMEYKIGDGEWYPYEGFLMLDRSDFEAGAEIYARVKSAESYYITSDSSYTAISVDPFALTGVSNGNFHDVSGQFGTVTNLNYFNSSDEYFEWGRISTIFGEAYEGFSKSWMEFGGMDIKTQDIGERFLIGDLDYFNGKFLADSGAEGVNLALDVALNVGGQLYNTEFDYQFELINTVNNDLDLYGWDSADFVKINQSKSSTMFEVNGVTLELVLEFGDSTANGFTDFDEFHIREEMAATTNVYATIFDRTASQGTVDSSGLKIEAPLIAQKSALVVEDTTGGVAPPTVDNSGSTFWTKLASWLASF